jgi:tRNA-dihydrouridine synthase B
MLTSDTRLWRTRKSSTRLSHHNESGPRSVQIAGACASLLADAARAAVDHGAQIVDINMGCPAKKVCNVAAGSALMRDEALVGTILDSVVSAVAVPVTLKIRTGWSPARRNAVSIARIAERAGVAALAVHGRTRACAFKGHAEYDTIAEVKQAVAIPVIANGDIVSPQDAACVLARTGADAVMIGRAAQGNPWVFREIDAYLTADELVAPPTTHELRDVLGAHLVGLYQHYDDYLGVRIARKHLSWYCKGRANARDFWTRVNQVSDPRLQLDLTLSWIDSLDGPADNAVELLGRAA